MCNGNATATPQSVNPGLADKGPWSAHIGARKGDNSDVPCAIIASDDFEHDVWMYVSGDFGDMDQALAYAQGIAQRLNATTPKE